MRMYAFCTCISGGRRDFGLGAYLPVMPSQIHDDEIDSWSFGANELRDLCRVDLSGRALGLRKTAGPFRGVFSPLGRCR